MKKRKIKRPILSYLRELTIVFIGVFIAFLINDFRNRQIEKRAEREIYQMIYDDLDRFTASGNRTFEQGFIRLFETIYADTDSTIRAGGIPSELMIIGDYWQVELVGSLLNSGRFYGLDPGVYTNTSRFYTVHQNLIQQINLHNAYYENHVLPAVYSDTNEQLKMKYERLLRYQQNIIRQAEVSVMFAEQLKTKIKEDFLD